MFNFDLYDFKIKLKAQSTLFRINNFKTRVRLNPVFVSTKMKESSMKLFGADLYLFVGFINPKWNIGAELTYNRIFSSYITHTDIYKENMYSDVKEGWYKI